MKTGCSFRFGFWDVNACADGVLSANAVQPFARVQDANREGEIAELPSVVTFERGFIGWPLDGSREVMPDNAEDLPWGWWSKQQCGLSCAFTSPPTLTVEFRNAAGERTAHSSVGITLVFAGALPAELTVKWFDIDGEEQVSRTFQPDGAIYFCDCAVENYAMLEITVTKMQWPYCFLRVTNIIFGAFEEFGDSETISAELTEEVSISGEMLPVSGLNLSFYTTGGRFALLNPSGQYKYFQYRQKIAAYQEIDGKTQKCGEYYLDTASAEVDAVAVLKCVDIIGILDGEEYKGGFYQGETLAEVLDEILSPLAVGFEVCDEPADVPICGWLDAGSVRSALQKLVFAVGGYASTAGEGKLRILGKSEEREVIAPGRKVLGHKVTMNELITAVSVAGYSYKKKSSTEELWRGELNEGEHYIYFDEPGEVLSVTGAELIEKFDRLNGCRVSVSTAGEVTVNGYAWEVTERDYRVAVPGVPVGTREKIKKISGVKVLSGEMAQERAVALCEYYCRRYTDEGVILPCFLSAGAIVELQSLGGMSIAGQIERTVTDLSGGGLRTIKVVGIAK